jgi:hypothetical protein
MHDDGALHQQAVWRNEVNTLHAFQIVADGLCILQAVQNHDVRIWYKFIEFAHVVALICNVHTTMPLLITVPEVFIMMRVVLCSEF